MKLVSRMLQTQQWINNLKTKTGLPKVIGVKPAKDSLTVKSIFLSKTFFFFFFLRGFSQGLKYEKLMNSCTYLDLARLSPFYKEFGVGLLVRCHYHHVR